MATHPENSMSAFRHAIAVGADEVEMDVRLSRDGVPVVCHDATVDRTTNGAGAVCDLTAAELADLDAGDGCGVPTVADVLRELSVPVLLELKTVPAAREVVQRVATDRTLPGRVRFCSFHPQALEECARTVPWAPRSMVTMSDPYEAISLAREVNAHTADVYWPLLAPDVVQKARLTGLGVTSFVVDEASIHQALRLGLDGVTANDPGPLRAIIDRHAAYPQPALTEENV
jgi:glycerophosphoryl diester phosphodiesterase